MATYTGMGGTASYSGSTIAQVKSWRVTSNVEPIDTTAMGNVWRTTVGGLASWEATVEVDFENTTGQIAMTSAVFVTTPIVTGSVTLVLTIATSKTLTGTGLVTSIDLTHVGSDSAVARATFEVKGSGPLLIAWA